MFVQFRELALILVFKSRYWQISLTFYVVYIVYIKYTIIETCKLETSGLHLYKNNILDYKVTLIVLSNPMY